MAGRRARKEALESLRELVELLCSRFGNTLALGALKAAVNGHIALNANQQITATMLADTTGLSKQSISRWLQKAPYVRFGEHPDDGRSKVIECTDLDEMLLYVDDLLEIFSRVESTAQLS